MIKVFKKIAEFYKACKELKEEKESQPKPSWARTIRPPSLCRGPETGALPLSRSGFSGWGYYAEDTPAPMFRASRFFYNIPTADSYKVKDWVE